MQVPDEQSRPFTTPKGRDGISPTTAFLILLGAIVLIGGILYLVFPTDTTSVTGSGTDVSIEPSFELTDAEAIARFEELDTIRQDMYRNRDASLASVFLTHDSPLHENARAEVSQLLRDDVEVEPNFTTRRIRVVANTPDEITIRQVVLEAPRFTSESGEELTETRPRIKAIEWVLQEDGGVWRIFSSDTIRTRAVGQS